MPPLSNWRMTLMNIEIIIAKIVTLQLGICTVSYFSYSNKSSSCMFPDGSYFHTDKSFDVIRNCYEIQLVDGEYAMLKILLLCNPTWDRLSPSARSILSDVQKKYTSLLLDLCMNTIIHRARMIVFCGGRGRGGAVVVCQECDSKGSENSFVNRADDNSEDTKLQGNT
ncbi:hypothetical protein PRIPAC_96580, partial [Pristionchus pacificus]|uniref:Uncharacterized protein n=1 Tax=Pristionchus pacificus TaxID=54126 RepID=A0A2A6B3B2_PRIPA